METNTNNNPIQMLMDEHDNISSAGLLIQSMDNNWKDDKNSYIKKVRGLLHFFREYSDKFHHYKEEKVLFKELNDNPDFLLNDLIFELEEHHEMFRETVKEIEKTLSDEDFEKVHSLLSKYINDLLDHIAVENDELFVIAESLFSEDELERMYFQFKDIDNELGQQLKQELKQSLKTI